MARNFALSVRVCSVRSSHTLAFTSEDCFAAPFEIDVIIFLLVIRLYVRVGVLEE